jgi:hypothetical protein
MLVPILLMTRMIADWLFAVIGWRIVHDVVASS